MGWLNLPPQIWCWLLQFPCYIPQVDCCGWQLFSLENSTFYWWFCWFSCPGLWVLLLVVGWLCLAQFDNFLLFLCQSGHYQLQKISAPRLGPLIHAHLVGWKSLGKMWRLRLRSLPGGFWVKLRWLNLTIISHSPLHPGGRGRSFPLPFSMQMPLPGKMCFNCDLNNFETCSLSLLLAPCQAWCVNSPLPYPWEHPSLGIAAASSQSRAWGAGYGVRPELVEFVCLSTQNSLGMGMLLPRCWNETFFCGIVFMPSQILLSSRVSLCHGMLHRDWEFVCV